ncbi:restriction endonuclease subunit S [Lactobacillus delbrueckii]|uniref:restriction endonuclease subunit S n=1 Tax=Lactobacillus delbrueckii TaxID=1584 RepID=UPI003A88B383
MVEYESYKSSFYDWLGKIPSHWEEKFLEQTASEKCDKNIGNTVTQVLSLSYGEIKKKGDLNKGLIARDLSTYQIIAPGNIVMRLTDLQNDHKSLRTGLVKDDGIITAAYLCLAPRISSEYLHYLLHAYDVKKVFYGMGGGVRQSIGFKDIRHMYIPVPPRAEQDQIVRFLDWKVSEINKLIGIRRQEIQELEELKRSRIGSIIMGQFQTQKKKSDISWVEAIPLSWKEKPLIQYAYERCIKNDGMLEDNLLSLSYGKVIDKDINTTDGLLPASFESYQIVEPGNIILRLTDLQNDHKSLRTGLVTQRGIITSAYTCLETRGDILPEFLQLELHVADLCKVFYGMGGGVRQSIGFKDIKRMLIAIPPLSEQHRILDLIHGIDAPTDKQKEQYLNIINELEELKKVIISDVVTGKIDVRNITVPKYKHVDDIVDDDLENNEETETDREEA